MDVNSNNSNSSVNYNSTSDTNGNKPRQARPGRACDTCRRRKVRCDGGGPATEPGQPDQPCVLCVNQGIPCTFEQRTTKRGPPKGYVESLERRLEAMEALLSQFAPNTGGGPNNTSTPQDSASAKSTVEDDRNLYTSQSDSSPIGSSPRNSLPPTGLDAIDELGLKLGDLAIERNRYIGRASGIHLMHSIQQYADATGPRIIDDNDTSAVEMLLDQEHEKHMTKTPLPTAELGNKLVDAAYKVFDAGRVIPRFYFDECMSKGMLESDSSFRSLYFALLALGSRAIPNTTDPVKNADEVRIAQGWHWFRASWLASRSPFGGVNLFIIMRALVLIGWQLGAGGLVSCWLITGFTIRQAIDVGAHCEDRNHWKMSPLQNQLRKRAFISLVLTDYYISACLGRPLTIQPEDWDLTSPLDVTDEQLQEWEKQAQLARAQGLPVPQSPPEPSPSTSSGLDPPRVVYPWSTLTDLHSIMADIMKSLYGLKCDKTLGGTRNAVRALDSRLNAWLEQVPASIKWNPLQHDDATLTMSATIYCAYYSCQIYIHREFVSPSRSAALGFPSLAICSNAARSSAHVLDTLRQRNLIQSAYSFAPISACHNAFVLLLGKFSSADPNAQLTPSAAADVKRCINVLHDLSHTTYMAMKCYGGILKLASLVAKPPPTKSNGFNNSTSSNLKRANPDGWNDGASPAPSTSDRPSPGGTVEDSGIDSSTGSHKQRKTNRSRGARDRMGLPLSTLDLSAETFNGRPTFIAEMAALVPESNIPPNGAGQPQPYDFSASSPALPGTASSKTSGTPHLPTYSSMPSDPFGKPVDLPFTSSPIFFDPVSSSSTGAAPAFSLPDPPSLSSSVQPIPGQSLGGEPNSSIDPFVDLRLSNEFFSWPLSTPTSQIPSDIGQAAADIFSNFGAAAIDFDGTSFYGNSVNAAGAGSTNGGVPLRGENSTSFDPFASWDLSGNVDFGATTSNGTASTTSAEPVPTTGGFAYNGWNTYDPSMYNNPQ